MARRLPMACRWPGCPAVTRERYCPAHTRAHRQRYEAGPARRKAKRLYGESWPVLRRQVLGRQPLCACGRPTTQVDHIIPLRLGGQTTEDNLRAMCMPCHSRKTAGELPREADGRWG